MSNADLLYAGGALGGLSRAAQLEGIAFADAKRKAEELRRRSVVPPRPAPPRAPVPNRLASKDLQFGRMPNPLAPPPPPAPKKPPGMEVFRPYAGPADTATVGPASFKDLGFADRHENRPEFSRPAPPPPPELTTEEKQQRTVYKAFLHDDGAGKAVTADQVNSNTIRRMVDDVMHDPIASPEKRQAAEDLARMFRDKTQWRIFTPEDLVDNPVVRTLNDIAAWSRFRIKVSEWKDQKRKKGDNASTEDAGDGTFTGLIENGSFSSVTSPSALAPYIVTRDEHGLLTVVTADQWIQGKYTDMHKDPVLAAKMVTALALTSMYGTDTTANAQASRVAVDKNGNPVKAIASGEDLAALKRFANEAVIFQNQGEEIAIDDVLSSLVGLGVDVSARNKANGEQDGGSGGGGGGGRRGGGGGGFGGGGQSVRLSDPAMLGSQLDSIARTRIGQSLTAEQHAEFVRYYHQRETEESAKYYAGQPFTQLDPQAQAVEWIESRFGKEAAANQYGELALRFVQMMGSSNPFSGVGS